MSISRRQFVMSTAAVALAGCRGSTGDPAPATRPTTSPAPREIVDSHQHVWDLQKFRLPWLDRAGPVLKRDYSIQDYLDAAAGLNVRRAVYVEVSVEPAQRPAEVEAVTELCRRTDVPTAVAVIGGSPAAEGFREYIIRFKDNPVVRGVRESFRKGSARDARFVEGIKLLGGLGLSFDLLAGPETLSDAADLAAACPETRMILDHCGGGSAAWFAAPAGDTNAHAARDLWQLGITKLAARPNVYCKISGVAENAGAANVTPEGLAPVVNHCLEQFGPDRVVFGSNWPVCLNAITFRGWVDLLTRITAGRGDAFARKLFRDNAIRFYRIPDEKPATRA
jgi:predicted TIM-barrel fold metal-dependent hydrolase